MDNYACAILYRDGRILLGKRAAHRRRDPNRWDVIGGRVEESETLDQALGRELGEELGITPTGFIAVAALEEPRRALYGKATYHMHLVVSWTGGEPRLNNPEHTKLSWFAIDEAAALPDLALPECRDLFRQIGRYRDQSPLTMAGAGASRHAPRPDQAPARGDPTRRAQ